MVWYICSVKEWGDFLRRLTAIYGLTRDHIDIHMVELILVYIGPMLFYIIQIEQLYSVKTKRHADPINKLCLLPSMLLIQYMDHDAFENNETRLYLLHM